MIKAKLWIEDFGFTKKLLIKKDNMDGSLEILKPAVFEKHKRGLIYTSFLESIDDDTVTDFMQAICNEAWENGIYPIQLADKADELKATKYHLEDMRILGLKDIKKC